SPRWVRGRGARRRRRGRAGSRRHPAPPPGRDEASARTPRRWRVRPRPRRPSARGTGQEGTGADVAAGGSVLLAGVVLDVAALAVLLGFGGDRRAVVGARLGGAGDLGDALAVVVRLRRLDLVVLGRAV